jgi:hypothetical protein
MSDVGVCLVEEIGNSSIVGTSTTIVSRENACAFDPSLSRKPSPGSFQTCEKGTANCKSAFMKRGAVDNKQAFRKAGSRQTQRLRSHYAARPEKKRN